MIDKKLNKEIQPSQKIIENLINLHTSGKLDDAKKKNCKLYQKISKSFHFV